LKFKNVGFHEEGKIGVLRKKANERKRKNQQQTQPSYEAEFVIRTRELGGC